MAAIAFTFVRATPHQLIYSFDAGVNAGTLIYATFAAATVAGPLKTAIDACAGQCDSSAKAVSALISGESFVGALSLAAIITNIQSTILLQTTTAATTTPSLTAVDGGGGNSPDLLITPDAGGAGGCAGFLMITHRWSPTV